MKRRVFEMLAWSLPLLVTAPPSAAQDPSSSVDVTVLAINDFHGNLLPPPGGIKIPDPEQPAADDRRAGWEGRRRWRR